MVPLDALSSFTKVVVLPFRKHGDVLQWALVDPSGIGSSKLSHQGSNAGILVVRARIRARAGAWVRATE